MSIEPTSNEIADQFNKMHEPPEEYSVKWASAKRWNYDATYDVKEFRTGEGGKPMLLIEGPGGGEYIIDSNPVGQPKVRYPKDGREDRLAEIEIYGRQFSWRHRIMKTLAAATSAIAE